MTNITTSNFLADLAARIKSEHEAATLALQTGLQHAIACGRMLREAKADPLLKHGQWLPWLREYCAVPERTVQRYMDLAKYAADDSKSANLADLALDGAAQIAAEEPPEDLWELLGWTLDAPFHGWDFYDSDGHLLPDLMAHVRRKLLHKLDIPEFYKWCISVEEYGSKQHPTLRICPWDDLIATVKKLAPIADAEFQAKIKFNGALFATIRNFQNGIGIVEIERVVLCGGILWEFEHRQSITDAQYAAENEQAYRHVMKQLNIAARRYATNRKARGSSNNTRNRRHD